MLLRQAFERLGLYQGEVVRVLPAVMAVPAQAAPRLGEHLVDGLDRTAALRRQVDPFDRAAHAGTFRRRFTGARLRGAAAGVTSSRRESAGVGRLGGRDLFGRASATIRPPSSPPSGPMSMSRSAVLITSRLCSITTTRIAGVHQPVQHSSSFSMSAKCSPVVGSSRM